MDGGHIVLSGWLKKSPREKKFGLRIWRKRWFVLRGGQRRSREGVLEYYENSCSKKPRGSIDLSLCEALNSGVTFQSTRQPKGFVFGIETRERTFYLLARSEDDMHKWVESICQICGLGPVEENTATEFWRNVALSGPGSRSLPAELGGSSKRLPQDQKASALSSGGQSPSDMNHPQPAPQLQPTSSSSSSSTRSQELLSSYPHFIRAPGSARDTNIFGDSKTSVLVRAMESAWSFIQDSGQPATVAQHSQGLSKPHWHEVGFQKNTSPALQSPTDTGNPKCSHAGPKTYIRLVHQFQAHRFALYLNTDTVLLDDPEVPAHGVPRTFTRDESHEVMASTRSPAVARMCPSQKPSEAELPPRDCVPQKDLLGNNGGSFSAAAITPEGSGLPMVDDSQVHPLTSPRPSACPPALMSTRQQGWLQPVQMAPILQTTTSSRAQLFSQREQMRVPIPKTRSAEPTPHAPGQSEPALPTDEPPTERTMKARRLEQLVNQLVPALLSGDPFFLPSFLHCYRDLGTTQQVLDLLFKVYGYLHPGREEDEQIKKTLCSILRTWLDRHPEDFCRSPSLANLHRLMDLVQLLLPASDLALQIKLFLLHLNDPLLREPEPKDTIWLPPVHRHLKPDWKTKPMMPNPDGRANLEQPLGESPRVTGSAPTWNSCPDLGLELLHGAPSMDRGDSKETPIFPPSTFSLHSDEKVQYTLVDQEKTQALQCTRKDLAEMRRSRGPPKGTTSL